MPHLRPLTLLNLLCLALLAGLLLLPAPPALASDPVSNAPADLLQFTSGGQVLGFTRTGVYAADGRHAYHVTFAGGAADPVTVTSPSKGDRRALPLSRVTYPNLWPGISLAYDAPPGTLLRSTYHLDPGADPARIRLRYNAPARLDPDGSLLLAYPTGQIRESAPLAWQVIGGQRRPVDVAFTLVPGQEGQEVGFRLGRYHPAYPLFIDPSLVWNTFIGGSSYAIALDDSGNIYVAGAASAWGTPINPYAGGTSDAFVIKLDSSGSLLWYTFMGGTGSDSGYGMALDSSGNIYVAGISEIAWGTPVNPYAGSSETFVAKLDNNGSRLWHTFLGSTDIDDSYDLAIDGSDNIYVTGFSRATWGVPLNPYTGGDDAFVAKLDSSGSRLWHTFLGGTDTDFGNTIAVDSNGNIYVAGLSNAAWGVPVNPHAGEADAFAAKLDSSGARLWHTFIGGAGTDYGFPIAVDSSSKVYVAGISTATWGVPVNPYTGSLDAYVAKLDSNGSRLWHTFMGGTNVEYGNDLAVDSGGSVYLAGVSYASWGTPLNPYAGGASDAFAAKLDSSGSRLWHTFLGGAAQDSGDSIAIDGSSSVYVAGYSGASWGVPVNPLPHGAFVAKIVEPDMAVLGNQAIIADGDATPSLTDHTGFGSVSLGGAITRTFTISNTGALTLTLTGSPVVSLTGPAAGDFSVVSQPGNSIGPGGSTSFRVRFDAAVAGPRAATFTIASDDSDENPYDFAIMGSGTPANAGNSDTYLPLIVKGLGEQ